jgi:DNA-binding NarL/FixJ family response regulator
LSDHELNVLRLLAVGFNTYDIATALLLSEKSLLP